MTEPWHPAPPSPLGDPAPAPAVPPAAPPAVAAPPTVPAPPAVAAAATVPPAVAPAGDASPFDPAGVTWQRVSPKLVTVRLISLALSLGIPLVVSAAVAAFTGVVGLWAIPAVLAGIALWLALLIPRQVRALGYAERDDDLLIRKGIMFRALVVVPYGRMQFVDVQAGPLDRWGGIAKVQLHTASPASDAAIPGLSPAEADRLRDRLAERGEARLAGL